MGRSVKGRKLLRLLAWLALSVVLALVLVFMMHRSSLEVIAEWKQPPDLPYDNRGPYYLSVVEGDLDWRGFPLGSVERNHFIHVGRDSGKPHYGHMLDFSFYPPPNDNSLERFLGKAEVEWTAEGVQLNLLSGHRVFVPAKMFTGGR